MSSSSRLRDCLNLVPQSGGTPYFLQRCNLRPAPDLATRQSSTLLSSSKGPTTEVSTDGKQKGVGTRSVVNKTYTLSRKLEVLHYVANFSETEASRHFGTHTYHYPRMERPGQVAKREEHFEEKAQEQEWSWPSDYLWRRLGHITLSVGAGNA